jgi:predicted alpha/beta hydrolase family esterase
MAARWSALALSGQVLLATGLAATLAELSTLSRSAIAVWVIVELYGVALVLVIAPLALGRAMAPGELSRRRMGHLLLAVFSDALAFEMAMGRMACEPWRAPPELAAAGSPAPRPLLLVHGFACSGAVWRPLLARLRAAGIGPARAVSLEPLFAGMETYATGLLSELEKLHSSSGGGGVTIVAHSMGALVARAALRRARPGLIGRIITIGAPHHGTALACRFSCPGARQMRPESPWLEKLNASQEGRLTVSVTTVYSLDDNYVSPPCSARFRGAHAVELQGIGHLGLLTSKRVHEHLISELLA